MFEGKTYPRINGIYRHYKGGLYQVLFLSKHTETNEVLVNYKSLHFGTYYSRPLDIWNFISQDGIPRFVLVDDLNKKEEI